MEIDPAGEEEAMEGLRICDPLPETNSLPQVHDLATSLSLLGHMFPELEEVKEELQEEDKASPGQGWKCGEGTGDQLEEQGDGLEPRPVPELQNLEGECRAEASPGRGSDPGEGTEDDRGDSGGETLTPAQPEDQGTRVEARGRPLPEHQNLEEVEGERRDEASPGQGSDHREGLESEPSPRLEEDDREEVAEPPPPPPPPSHRDEDVTAEAWRRRRKHVFVLSEAGKPIYSRHGSEEALSSTMGVMMALVSFVQSGGNAIRSVHSDDHTVVFVQKGPLVLVSVSNTRQPEPQLQLELLYVYHQIVSILTRATIARVFSLKTNYDLRRLLAGSEKILDGLVDQLDSDPGFLLGAVRCLALAASQRDALSQILQKAVAPDLAFSLLVARGRLVTLVQERAVLEDARLDPADVHLLLNLIGASSAFRAGEIWTPVCLPGFNPDGYFYAYVSYLDPGPADVCLVLLSTDREAFYAAAGCKRRIEAAMTALGGGAGLGGLLGGAGPWGAAGPVGGEYGAGQVGVADLRHFLYKPFDVPDDYRQLTQFTSPEMEAPYGTEEERTRLLDLYRYLHGRIHSSSRPLKLIYHVAERETLLAWVTSKFELYTCFSPLVTKARAIAAVTKLLRWIKKEEERLFIRYPPKFSTSVPPPNQGRSSRAGRSDQAEAGDNGFLALL